MSGFVGFVAGVATGQSGGGGGVGRGARMTSRTKLGLPALAVTLAAAGARSCGEGQRSKRDKQVVCLSN